MLSSNFRRLGTKRREEDTDAKLLDIIDDVMEDRAENVLIRKVRLRATKSIRQEIR